MLTKRISFAELRLSIVNPSLSHPLFASARCLLICAPEPLLETGARRDRVNLSSAVCRGQDKSRASEAGVHCSHYTRITLSVVSQLSNDAPGSKLTLNCTLSRCCLSAINLNI